MAHPTELDALYAFLAAAVLTALLTPLTMRFARAIGAIDEPRERGLSESPTPLLGGLAIFAGVLLAGLIWLPAGYATEHQPQLWHGVLIAAAVITLVGALDDRFDLHPALKLLGQVLAAVIVVHFGVAVKAITLPFVGHLTFPNTGAADAGPRSPTRSIATPCRLTRGHRWRPPGCGSGRPRSPRVGCRSRTSPRSDASWQAR